MTGLEKIDRRVRKELRAALSAEEYDLRAGVVEAFRVFSKLIVVLERMEAERERDLYVEVEDDQLVKVGGTD